LGEFNYISSLLLYFAADLNFEEAMKIREQIKTLREKLIAAE